MEWIEMDETQTLTTLRTMQRFGGGFASKLADAWMAADSTNASRLRDAFPEMARKYGPGTALHRDMVDDLDPVRQ